MHQPTLIENAVVTLRVVRDGRVGSRVDEPDERRGAPRARRQAAEAADLAPRRSRLPRARGAGRSAEVDGYDEATAALGAEELARLAAAAIAATGDLAGVRLLHQRRVGARGRVDRRASAAHQRMTDATALVIAAGEDASGYAEQTSSQASPSTRAASAARPPEKAARTRGAASIEPSRVRAVLEPYALGELLQWFAWDSFSGLGLIEERSALCGRLGEPIADPKVTIWDDPLDPAGSRRRSTSRACPSARRRLIENGVARGVVWDRTTAARSANGQVSTGHARRLPLRVFGPLPSALSVSPGEAESVDELTELVGEGIYITRLHYLGIVNPREGVITGMTRDGTFRIRGGRIAEPLVNLRFTVAVPDLLAEVPGLTRRRLLVNQSEFYDERYPHGVLTPALATASFNVTGLGSGPGL